MRVREFKLILVVDGDEGNASTMVQKVRQKTEHLVFSMSDIHTLLEFLSDVTPDLVVLSYQPSDVDDIELYNRLQTIFETRNIPVLLLRNRVPQDEGIAPERANVVVPVSTDELLAKIDMVLYLS